MIAAREGLIGCLTILLAFGADVHARNKVIQQYIFALEYVKVFVYVYMHICAVYMCVCSVE